MFIIIINNRSSSDIFWNDEINICIIEKKGEDSEWCPDQSSKLEIFDKFDEKNQNYFLDYHNLKTWKKHQTKTLFVLKYKQVGIPKMGHFGCIHFMWEAFYAHFSICIWLKIQNIVLYISKLRPMCTY